MPVFQGISFRFGLFFLDGADRAGTDGSFNARFIGDITDDVRLALIVEPEGVRRSGDAEAAADAGIFVHFDFHFLSSKWNKVIIV